LVEGFIEKARKASYLLSSGFIQQEEFFFQRHTDYSQQNEDHSKRYDMRCRNGSISFDTKLGYLRGEFYFSQNVLQSQIHKTVILVPQNFWLVG
jgi:hypothetical protein